MGGKEGALLTEGFEDGATDGLLLTEGFGDGAVDGAADGLLLIDGFGDGATEGVKDGGVDGVTDGTTDGALDGALDGAELVEFVELEVCIIEAVFLSRMFVEDIVCKSNVIRNLSSFSCMISLVLSFRVPAADILVAMEK